MYILCFWSKNIYEVCPVLLFTPSDKHNIACSRLQLYNYMQKMLFVLPGYGNSRHIKSMS